MILDYCNNGDFKKFMLKKKFKRMEERVSIPYLK